MSGGCAWTSSAARWCTATTPFHPPARAQELDRRLMPSNVRTRVLLRTPYLSIYLVHYRAGHRVLPHVDGVARGRLYKLNCVLVKPERGGEFHCERTIFNLRDRLVLFRPDLHEHAVSRIEAGSRWLLSFAVLRGG